MLLYLHGFGSSPDSHKARRTAAAAAARGLAFACPQLPVSPSAAGALAEDIIASGGERVTLIGSSLGGHYATWLAERHDCRAVLVNPAVVAALDLDRFVGRHPWWGRDEYFEFTAAHAAELRALDVAAITRPERYWLLAEEGDEVLDYRHAVAKYAGARQTVLPGGDHSFSRWDAMLDAVLDFATAS